MKDTLKQLLVDCLNASKKGGSGGGVDPSKFPSQVIISVGSTFIVAGKPSTSCINKMLSEVVVCHQFSWSESYTLY